MREEDKWLTALVCDAGLFEFNRAPFGLRNSGPIREFTDSFVDDVAVHSDQWKGHMNHLDQFLHTVKTAGVPL